MAETHNWESQNWQDLVPRLLLYTRGILARKVWYGLWAGPPPAGKEAEDFVMEAIKRTISGRRQWRQDVDLYWHLVGVIRSLVYHAGNEVENLRTNRLDVVDGDAALSESKVILFHSAGLNPEFHTGRAQQLAELEAYLRREDELLAELAQCILVLEISKTDCLSDIMEIPPRKIENLKKRLRRHMKRFLDGQNQISEKGSNG